MELAEEVDRYLRRTGMTASRFGRLVAQDPSLVSDLRRGRHPLPRLRARIWTQLGRTPDMGRAFAEALIQAASPHGFVLITGPEITPWASAGFVGEQVVCGLAMEAGADRRWAAALPDHGWRLPFLVADLAIAWTGDGVRVIALLLPDG